VTSLASLRYHPSVNVFEARDLTLRYPGVLALDGLTLEVPHGAVGLLGQNGAGKSTLIKVLLGFLPPGSGSASVLGLDPRRDALAIRARVGYMPEIECLPLHLSAVDAVHLAARLSGLPHVDALQRTHRTLNYVGLQEERYRRLGSYSTGMKQKAKLAQAIVHHPKLLLLDEPTAGLDPRARDEMLALVRDLSRRQGIDVILSTHILPDVEQVCDHALILHRGRRVAQGPISSLLRTEERLYDVRVRGDREAFVKALRDRGVEPAPGSESGALRVTLDGGTHPLLEAAAASGIQLRRMARAQRTLEEAFLDLVAARP
jgi:ABC-2 type transport system ATP-binding protein